MMIKIILDEKKATSFMEAVSIISDIIPHRSYLTYHSLIKITFKSDDGITFEGGDGVHYCKIRDIFPLQLDTEWAIYVDCKILDKFLNNNKYLDTLEIRQGPNTAIFEIYDSVANMRSLVELPLSEFEMEDIYNKKYELRYEFSSPLCLDLFKPILNVPQNFYSRNIDFNFNDKIDYLVGNKNNLVFILKLSPSNVISQLKFSIIPESYRMLLSLYKSGAIRICTYKNTAKFEFVREVEKDVCDLGVEFFCQIELDNSKDIEKLDFITRDNPIEIDISRFKTAIDSLSSLSPSKEPSVEIEVKNNIMKIILSSGWDEVITDFNAKYKLSCESIDTNSIIFIASSISEAIKKHQDPNIYLEIVKNRPFIIIESGILDGFISYIIGRSKINKEEKS